MRLEVFFFPAESDSRIRRIQQHFQHANFHPGHIRVGDVYLISEWEGLSQDLALKVLCDPIAQRSFYEPGADSLLPGWNLAVEISFKPGVTDPTALTASQALKLASGRPRSGMVVPATLYLFSFEKQPSYQDAKEISLMFFNPLIQEARLIFPDSALWMTETPPPKVFIKPQVELIPLTNLEFSALEELSSKRLLALSGEEMKAIQNYYRDPKVQEERKSKGLGIEPTDVELEMLAQTWSEHCKHKIFQADIEYHQTQTGELKKISSLYKTYIKNTTKLLEPLRPFLRSVFTDNSGVIALDDENLVCFKVETHNSPSALDPYGGAITGIVGVNRDILGTGLGAKPIWNTNVLCFGPPETLPENVPKGLLPPLRVLEGVHKGIVDGGNHSGIPTVSGAFLFDDSYLGKPLVFCGTGGILPHTILGKNSWEKSVTPGSLAVMCGGRIGKDGIHGATFSSLALDDSSPTSAVQIGDPIIQKIMTDFLLEARDLGLFESLTDNGAGGLSSSLGEMAQSSGGIRVDLEKCPLKYPGLASWEIWISESQERMSFSVRPELWNDFSSLAIRRGVEATVIGTFTDSGKVELLDGGTLVGLMDMGFLHEGLPTMKLKAVWSPPVFDETPLGIIDCSELLLKILSDPNVGTKESLIRQYDHEVQGRSLVKPFTGIGSDGPSDGGALKLAPGHPHAVSVTHGVCPRVGDRDAYAMAQCAVDEALRAHVALGGDPEFAAVLDNFCWPDPVQSMKTPDGEYKLAQLVRANEGLQDACLDYQLPIISGKDSMKNDAWAEGKKISVRPTLLISLLGKIPYAEKVPDTDFLSEGDVIFLVGETSRHLAGSMAERILQRSLTGIPLPNTEKAFSLYKTMHAAINEGLLSSVHDLSDGGLAVALAESCIGGRLGASIELEELALVSGLSSEEILFSETPSRFLVSVSRVKLDAWKESMNGQPHLKIGVTTGRASLEVKDSERVVLDISMESLLKSWRTCEEVWS